MAWETVGGSRLATEFRRRAALYIANHWPDEHPKNRIPSPPMALRNGILIKLLNVLRPEIGSYCTETKRKNIYRFWINSLPPVAKSGKNEQHKQTVATFYDSREWREVRYAALVASKGCCQCCGNRASKDNPLHVDHIKPRSKFPELELDKSNLQVLCADCNLGKSNKDQTDWRESSVACAETGSATVVNGLMNGMRAQS